ncbi:MAG: MBL fold metallo-hydrolase, partial [Candidatus Wildermuthbacteria bacterium]|nr:MBL fold metallo-hydrolase [Candidatus Wildermuthbacteria bacterium]
MEITFFGAAQNVTGSKHLIQTQNYNLLLDCGLYQGKRAVSNELNRNLPFQASKIDAVILSHAHLDHCGTLPILARSRRDKSLLHLASRKLDNGFKGKIYCAPATADIVKYLLLDSAEIQKQDANYFNRRLAGGESPISPIYTKEDVKNTLEHFERVPYFRESNKWTELNSDIRFKLYDAGHILGSAITLIEIKEDGIVKTLAFTGDLGRDSLPILRSPERIQEDVGTLLMECTYGDRIHRPMSDVANELKDVIIEAIRKKSKIIVPAFALGRTQELIYMLHNLIDKNVIPALPVYIDSPLAEKITDIFPKYTSDFDSNAWKDFGNRKESPFLSKNLIYVRSAKESQTLIKKQGPLMIISASGMAEGGRVLHHLKNNIDNPDNIILITGYQAKNTLGRKIQKGISPVKIYGENYNVKARVVTLDELSAHADQNDLLAYIASIKKLKNL